MVYRILVALLMMPTVALTAPSVTDVSGTTSVVVIGSDFGVKSTAAPIKFDNFEWAVNGTALTSDVSAPVWTSSAGDASISNSQAHAGSNSAYKEMEITVDDCSFTNIYVQFTETTEVYMSFWVRHATSTGSAINGSRASFYKFNRINTEEPYGGEPNFYLDFYPNNDAPETGRVEVQNHWGNFDPMPGHNIGRLYNSDFRQEQWHRVEQYLRVSTPGGTANGELQWFLNASEIDTDWSGNTFTPGITRGNGVTQDLGYFTLQFSGCGYTESEYPLLWQDDIYIDNTRARVELGNASTWDSCTHREIQIPTAWATDEITVDLNQGSLPNGAAYLYVVDEDGVMNETGYPITLGDSATRTSKPRSFNGTFR